MLGRGKRASIKENFTIGVGPGEVLPDILDSSGLTQSVLAKHLRVSHAHISEICRGARGLTPEMACKLGRAFGQSGEFWMKLQTQRELSCVPRRSLAHIQRIAPRRDAV